MPQSAEANAARLTPSWTQDEDDQASRQRVVNLSGVQARILLSPRLRPSFDDVFGHLQSTLRSTERDCAVTMEARDHGRLAHVWRDGSFAWSCKLQEFIPLIKADLTDVPLRFCKFEVALHAGAYVRQGRALLLLGSPGAGKTTLGMALAASGYDLLADDVVLLHDDARVSGLAFAPAVKSGAWDLIAPYWPGVTNAKVHVRPDGQRVRYAPAEPSAGPGRFPVASLVLLDRRAGASASLAPMDPVDALRCLLAEATSGTERLTLAGFSALIDALTDVRCRTLTYCGLNDAIKTLDEIHHD